MTKNEIKDPMYSAYYYPDNQQQFIDNTRGYRIKAVIMLDDRIVSFTRISHVIVKPIRWLLYAVEATRICNCFNIPKPD